MTNRVFHLHEGATYIEHQENHFHDHSQQVWNDTSKELNQAPDSEEPASVSLAVSDLLPFFYNDQAETEKFVGKISGARPTIITDLVNALLREGKISGVSCQKPMWEVMNRHNLYDKAYVTWAHQIRRPM